MPQSLNTDYPRHTKKKKQKGWGTNIIAWKAVPHVINSRALTGEKPCINKAIHALLMHGYATFNMIVPRPQNCCRYAVCTVQPQNEHSQWKLRSPDIGEKAKQNSARNNAKCSKCFQFLCNNSDRTWFFQCVNIRQVPRDLANANAWKTMFDPYNNKINATYEIIDAQTKKRCKRGTESLIKHSKWRRS